MSALDSNGLFPNGGTARRRVLRAQNIELDVRGQVISRGGQSLPRIPRKEFLILQLLLERAGQVVSREELKERAWGEVITPVSEKTLDVHVRRLRSRIERDPSNPDLIRTVRGTGYVFDTRPIPMGTADVTQAI